MKGKIFLNTRKGKNLKNGTFPLICEISWEGNQKYFSMKMAFFKENWDFNREEPKNDKAKQLIIRRKKSLLDIILLDSLNNNDITYDYIKNVLTGKIEYSKNASNKNKQETIRVDFFEYGYKLANEKKQEINDKGILKEGNGESYITALNQLRKIHRKLDISQIDYKLLTEFKRIKLLQGLKKNSISAYLKALSAIYNECIKVHKIKTEHDPFDGIFTGITVKKNRTKKRNLSKESIKIFESLNDNLPEGQQLAINLFLLQFYFGGQDFTDIYYLEKSQISKNNRVYFQRGKRDENGYQFDLKIFPKTQSILDHFKSIDKFIIPGRKDYKGYKNFIRRVNDNLDIVKMRYNEHVKRIEEITGETYHKLEVLPLGGKITTKVARHTFSTIGNRMFIFPDLLRALMGHERDHIDTIYKDVYPEKERDKHHFQIIDTSNIKGITKFIYCYEYLDSERKRNYQYKYFDKAQEVENLIDSVTDRKYSEPKNFKRIYLIKKL